MVRLTPIGSHVWNARYRLRDGGPAAEQTIEDTWSRVARALAQAEQSDQYAWAERFMGVMRGFRFLPGGRILAGAGTQREVTLFNCFVMGTLEDSTEGIFRALHESAVTLQQGGGIGIDFSTLRPAGSRALRTGNIASGPVSFLQVWDRMCATMTSTAARSGAMMGTLRCDHPDIEAFIVAKRSRGALPHFNLSVLASDAFMAAVAADADWPLVFPQLSGDMDTVTVLRDWPGQEVPVPCRIHRTLRARELWNLIASAACEGAEPGILFIDRIRHSDPLGYTERIIATNPCGEVPLPAYGACNLGSLNLCAFVLDPFTPSARLDLDALDAATVIAVRMLDNVTDISRFPLPAQAEQARRSRRIGIGITGLADALILLGHRYDSETGRATATEALRRIGHAAYRSSIALAREKGPFPALDRAQHLNGMGIRRLPDDIREGIHRHGLRNSHLTAIAPAGAISLLAGNVSSGIEPVFDLRYRRTLRKPGGETETLDIEDHAWSLWRAGNPNVLPPAYFVTSRDIEPVAQLAMVSALQPYVDSAISKTVNLAAGCAPAQVSSIFASADALGLKGCTVFPAGSRDSPIDQGCARNCTMGSTA